MIITAIIAFLFGSSMTYAFMKSQHNETYRQIKEDAKMALSRQAEDSFAHGYMRCEVEHSRRGMKKNVTDTQVLVTVS